MIKNPSQNKLSANSREPSTDELKTRIAEQNFKIHQLESIIKKLPGVVYWKNKQGVYLGCNDLFCEVAGTTDVIGKTDLDMPWQAESEYMRNNDSDVIKSAVAIEVEEPATFADGHKMIMLTHKAPYYNDLGEIDGVIGISVNITERKRLEEKLKTDRIPLAFLAKLNKEVTGQQLNSNMTAAEYAAELCHYYESIIACMPNNVYWLDTNYVLLGGNDNLASMFNLKSRQELVGLTYAQMSELANWTEGQGEALRRTDMEVMSQGIPRVNVEEPPVIINGETRYFISTKVPLYSMRNEIIGVAGISIDITDRKQAEIALIDAKEKAEAANKAKTEFLENMRHDIRTPLTGIVGFASIISAEMKDETIKEYVDSLTTSSNALLDLLNEILEVINLSSGEVPILKKKFNLKKRLQGVIDLNQARAYQKHLKLLFEYDDRIPTYIIGDSTRIHRFVLELITNALNFTEEGMVKLSVQLASSKKRNLTVKIIIEDTGIGIMPEKQQEIFLKFKRLTPSFEGIYKGAGLGLTIVKQFIDELDGEIYVESSFNKGTKFTCILPLKKALLDEEFGSEDYFISK